MPDTGLCTYLSRPGAPCPAAATHRVVRGWQQRTWRIEEGPVERPAALGEVRTVGWTPVQSAEFYLRHAGDVMQQRNRRSREQG